MFSIIIPTYKREVLLSKCLLSLNRQSDRDFLVYIVNDHYKKLDQIDITKYDFFIKIIENGHKNGPGYCRNLALDHINTDYCVFLDDDCIPLDGWSENINTLIKEERPEIVKGIQIFNKKDIFSLYHDLQIWGLNTIDAFCSTSNVLIKTDIAKGTLFDQRFSFSYEDVDFFLRTQKKIKFSKFFKVLHIKNENILILIKKSFLSGKGKAVFFIKHGDKYPFENKDSFGTSKIRKYISQLKKYIDHLRRSSSGSYKLVFFLIIDIIKFISNKVGFYYEKNRIYLFNT